VLDVGCAKGHICEAFRQAGLEAHGLDYSDVAVEKATKLFPACRFYHMDGMNPEFDRKFDLIFMRGFSGCNTLEIGNVAALCNRYLGLLQPGGSFVLGYSTDFSGRHRPGDTVCWSRRQIDQLNAQVHARCLGSVVLPPRNLMGRLKVGLGRLLGRRSKHYLYLFLCEA
jgi:SAM-dependent methyltransferase